MYRFGENSRFSKVFRNVRFIYMCAFLFALLFMRTIIPVSTFIPSAVDSAVFSLLAVLGCAIIVVDFFTVKDMFRVKYWYILVGFLAAMFISALVNYQYEFFGNIKTLVFSAIQFLVFMPIASGWDRAKIKKSVRIIGDVLSIFMLICSVISISQFVLQIGYELTRAEGGQRICQGFYESRLYGIYQDPNYASVTGVISAFLCMYNFSKVKNIFFRVFYVVNIIVQYMYTVMSGSRTAEICLLGSIFLVGYFFFRKYCSKLDFKRVTVVLASAVLALCCAVTVYTSVPSTKYVLQFVPSLISQKNNEPITFERVDVVGTSDVSNLRFKIWESGLEIYTGHPVFGTSPRAQLSIAEEEYPNGFVAQKKYLLHNGYLNVLVSTGTVGAIIMLGYIVLVLAQVWKKFFCKLQSSYDSMALIALVVVAIIAIATLFLTEIFFSNSVCALLFWFFLGVLLRLCRQDGTEALAPDRV